MVVMAALAAGFAGCESPGPGASAPAHSVPALPAEAARAAGFSEQEAADANLLCAVKCARCHKFYDPAEYEAKDWERWMRKMSRKARLQPEQQAVLTRYLSAFRERQK